MNYLKKNGEVLMENGYNFIPIIPHTADHKSAGKMPAFKGWQRSVIRPDLLSAWMGRYVRHGIGIITHDTPAVDIDITDPEVSAYMRSWVEENIGPAPVRIGRAPKSLLMFHTDRPFTKVKSCVWLDKDGNAQAVEVLGSGQQFVAFGIHPVTKKPYSWLDGNSPLNHVAGFDLTEITISEARDICDEFDRYARKLGWRLKDAKIQGGIAGESSESTDVDNHFDDDWLTTDDFQEKWDGSVEELAELMEMLPPAEDYSAWVPVLAMLKDAEREPDEFKEIARDWSARADNFDEDSFEEKWDKGNFGRITGPVASIRGLRKKIATLQAQDEVEDVIIPQFMSSQTLVEWERAAERLRETEIFGLFRDEAVGVAMDAFKRITKTKVPDAKVKKSLAFDWSRFDPPEWLEPWVFDSKRGEFFNRHSGDSVVPQTFNILFAASTAPFGVTPTVFASVSRPVPSVSGVMYHPIMHGDIEGSLWEPVEGANGVEFFSWNGRTYLNSFRPETLAAIPDEYTEKGLQAIKAVMHFFEVQFPDEDARRHLLDWISYVVSYPGRKISYAAVILGGEGSGKTIIKRFMTCLLGEDNVGTISNQVLHKTFNSWAAGGILKVIEEISVPGHRFDVLDALKEPITNTVLHIEHKGRDGVDMVNTANYMMFTNDGGALPVRDTNSRYLILQSRFVRKEHIVNYLKNEDPKFFAKFEHAFVNYPGEIRKFFSEWKRLPTFKPDQRAPACTSAMQSMIDVSLDDFTRGILDCIEDDNMLGVTNELIHSFSLKHIVDERNTPSRQARNKRLSEIGFTTLASGRFRLSLNGERGDVYARDWSKWVKGGEPDLDAISAHFVAQKRRIIAANDVWKDDD